MSLEQLSEHVAKDNRSGSATSHGQASCLSAFRRRRARRLPSVCPKTLHTRTEGFYGYRRKSKRVLCTSQAPFPLQVLFARALCLIKVCQHGPGHSSGPPRRAEKSFAMSGKLVSQSREAVESSIAQFSASPGPRPRSQKRCFHPRWGMLLQKQRFVRHMKVGRG